MIAIKNSPILVLLRPSIIIIRLPGGTEWCCVLNERWIELAVFSATAEAFARWLHRRYAPIELPSKGHIVSPRDIFVTLS